MVRKRENVEAPLRIAVEKFRQRVTSLYDVDRVFLFGSRARGTSQAGSDVDVAVLLRGRHRPRLETKLPMVELAYDILLDTGYYVQPFPIWLDEWEDPDLAPNPDLIRSIASEGVLM